MSKIPSVKLPTYNEYEKFLRNKGTSKIYKDVNHYLKKYNSFLSLANVMPCCVYLLDNQTRNYLFMSKHCKEMLGYTSHEILKGGQALMVPRFHPDDLKTLSDKQYIRYLEFTRSLPVEELKNSRFSLNYRIKRKDGVYIHLLQQYIVLETDEKGNPLLEMGVCIDITAHKSDNKIVFAISRYDEKKGSTTVLSDSFVEVGSGISKRENEVLKHLLQGSNSKQVAAKLMISPFTVNAHRRNLLAKTNSKNTVELINYAICNGLI